MARRWHIIDDDGSREVIVDHDRGRVYSGVKVKHDGKEWPPFTQLAIAASIDELVDAIHNVAEEFDLPCRRLHSPPEPGVHAIQFARAGGLTLVGEPDVAFEDRFVTAASSEAIAEYLETHGVHFGHDPAAGSLHLTRYEEGVPDFTWCDSLRPGPSFALTFHSDGRCTEEDPRSFALRRMLDDPTRDVDSSVDVCLDRRAFVQTELSAIGLTRVDPEFAEFSTQPGFAIDTETRQTPVLS